MSYSWEDGYEMDQHRQPDPQPTEWHTDQEPPTRVEPEPDQLIGFGLIIPCC